MSVWEQYTQLFARNRRCGRFAWSFPKGAQRRSERKMLSWHQGDGRADQFRSRSFWGSGDLRWKLDLLLWPRDQESSQRKHAGSPRPKRARQSKSTHKLLIIPFFDSTGMIYMHWVPTGQTVNKEYYVEVLREFRKRFLGKRPALFKSGQWHFYQDNAPVHNSILVTEYLTKMGIKTVPQPPYSPDLAPCDFCLFPKLKEKQRLLLRDNWGDERGYDEGHWQTHTRGLPWGLPEFVRTVQQSALQLEEIALKGTRVSCVYYQ